MVREDWGRWLEDPAFRQAVGGLRMPALLLHGAADPRPATYVQELAASMANSRFELIPKASHCPWVEQPTAVRTALRQSL